ncbi:proteoglycan 4 isoform X1 [Spatholobus suberectus]|nr:proteoglycan 4 isoform X1 [Spatholobus suberectus]
MKQGAEANAEHSRVSSKPELSPPLDIAFPIDSKVEKRAEPTEAKMEHPQACLEPKLASSIDLPTPTNLEKKKEADLREAHAQHPQPQPCSKHETAVLGINEEHPVPDPTPLEDTPEKS